MQSEEIHPVTGSGAAQSLRPVSTPKRELDGVSCTDLFHFGCAQTRASRRMWCLAARGLAKDRAHPGPPTPCRVASECMDTPEVVRLIAAGLCPCTCPLKSEMKKARILSEPGLLEQQLGGMRYALPSPGCPWSSARASVLQLAGANEPGAVMCMPTPAEANPMAAHANAPWPCRGWWVLMTLPDFTLCTSLGKFLRFKCAVAKWGGL